MSNPHELVLALLRGDSFLILTHRKPDGDTIGSAAALCALLREQGKTAFVAHNEEITPKLSRFVEDMLPPDGFMPGCVVAVDIADEQLYCPSMEQYKGKTDICIDHHPSNKEYAKLTFVAPRAAATGEVIWLLCDIMNQAPTEAICEAIYLAVATDTGCFRYSNTTSLSHEIAGACIEAGIDFMPINREFFEKKSRGRLAIERHIYENLKLSDDGKIAGCYLSRKAIEGAAADDDDLDNLSSLLMQIEGVSCGIFLTQTKDLSALKASVRTQRPVDAGAICANFGGGGHPRAAGCTLDLSPEQAHEAISDCARKHMGSLC